MKIAILSDVHGNITALDAVLEDVQSIGGVDEYWVLGDLVALGPLPVPVLERLHTLPKVQYVRGNTDRYVVSGERPYPHPHHVKEDFSLLSRLLQVTDGFSWTRGAITAHGWFPFLAGLPLELRVELPDGTRFLGVHASPGNDDGQGIHPDISDEALHALFAGCEADLVCVEHTHWPAKRQMSGVQVINLGSVSNPIVPGLAATYCLLNAESDGYQIEHRAVAYNREAVLAQITEVAHPAADFLAKFMRGEMIKSAWGTPDL
ncbi:MAG: metallophosphoesterase family protein [Anaerolineales bacterium]|nr:metallophosphoesterase family protein [Anaerolineales bacterium]